MYRSLLLLSWIISSTVCYGQHPVSGRVIVKGDGSVPGVNVVEKGTQNGIATDSLGNFSLTVSDPEAILIATFIGMVTTEFPLKGRQQVVINAKWNCTKDFFDSQDVSTYFSSGVLNTPVGGRIEVSSPWFLHGLVKASYGYQTDLGINTFQNADAGLYHYISNCDFDIDFVWHYRQVSYHDKMRSRANSVAANFNTGSWQYTLGYTHLYFNDSPNEINEYLSGILIGVGTVIPVKPYPTVVAKASLYKNRIEYQAVITGDFRHLVAFVKFYKLNTFHELSIGVGVKLDYRIRRQKSG